jgi:Tol biopolymer transport system component
MPLTAAATPRSCSPPRSGTLYFSSNRPGGLGENDIYRTQRAAGRWTTPENLGPGVNSAGREYGPYIAPDETYLIFASERPGGLGGADLYISVRGADGRRSKPANLGPAVNTVTSEYTPMVSPDGRHLFFTSGTAGSDDLFWIDAGVVRKAVAAGRGR